jgi:hypothetical protein
MPVYSPESRTQFGVNGDAAGTVDSCCFYYFMRLFTINSTTHDKLLFESGLFV